MGLHTPFGMDRRHMLAAAAVAGVLPVTMTAGARRAEAASDLLVFD